VLVRMVSEWRRKLGAVVGIPRLPNLSIAVGSSPEHRALSPRIPIPIANAIRWEPTAGSAVPASERYPLFVVRSTLGTMHEHLGPAPEPGALGFLIGNILECPETTVRYVVLHTSVGVAERFTNDDSLALVSRLWPAVQQEARAGGGEVLGWYHSHAGQGVALSPRDVATHLTYFPNPWQSALVIAADGDRLEGGVFRVAENDAWPEVAVPLYELFGPAQPGEPGEGEGDGRLAWTNYRIGDRTLGASPTASAAPAALPPGQATAHALPSVASSGTMPQASREEPMAGREPRPRAGAGRQPVAASRTADASTKPPALPVRSGPAERGTPAKPLQSSVRAAGGVAVRAGSLPAMAPDHGPFIPPQAFDADPVSAPWSERFGPLLRRVALGIGILVLLAGLWLWMQPSPTPSESAPTALPSAGAVIPHIRLTDSLEQALRGYGARQQLFRNQQMTCDDLASGLVAVDEQWVRYGIARRAGAELADSVRDNAFAARVGSVENAFDASGCPRP
jgi:proteasome lid subunit RPN8/RPN11